MATYLARLGTSASHFSHWSTLTLIIAVPLSAASGDTMDMVHPKTLPVIYSASLVLFVAKYRGIYKPWVLGLTAIIAACVAVSSTVPWLLYALSDLVVLAPFVPHVPPGAASSNREVIRGGVTDHDAEKTPRLDPPDQASQPNHQHQPSTLSAPGDNDAAGDHPSEQVSEVAARPIPWPPGEPSVRSDVSDNSRASQLDHQQRSQILLHTGPGPASSNDSQPGPLHETDYPKALSEFESDSDTLDDVTELGGDDR